MAEIKMFVCPSEKDADVAYAILKSQASGGFGATTVERTKVSRIVLDTSKCDDGDVEIHRNVWVVVGWK
jgi:hypothetical protein